LRAGPLAPSSAWRSATRTTRELRRTWGRAPQATRRQQPSCTAQRHNKQRG
jgi:hypothetical protein